MGIMPSHFDPPSFTPPSITVNRKACECEELAEQTDADIKEQFLKIAQQWRDMADHLEKYSR